MGEQMGSKLVFIRKGEQIISGLIDGNDLVEVQVENAVSGSLLVRFRIS